MNNLPNSILADILAEKIKRDSSEQYNQFVDSINKLSTSCTTMEELQMLNGPLEKCLPHLELVLSVTQDYDDIMNMKATLLDLFVNDLHHKSVYLLVNTLSSNKSLTNLQNFISPIEYWVTVIKSKEMLVAT
ncbi:hypothetical protein [Salipaludibacillus sp. CF4.18]|uniref:hypothetical protein n=1 Tax=Salipaludibacillus sp. CF4.18 TaxID=3373081 RepID=UPI003EE80F9C